MDIDIPLPDTLDLPSASHHFDHGVTDPTLNEYHPEEDALFDHDSHVDGQLVEGNADDTTGYDDERGSSNAHAGQKRGRIVDHDSLEELVALGEEHDPTLASGQDPNPRKKIKTKAKGKGKATQDGLSDDTQVMGDEAGVGGAHSAEGIDDEMEAHRIKKELNRLAAERSRSKKRGELAILEKTVTNIQMENDRLRTQLEALLSSAAILPSVPGQTITVPILSSIDNLASTSGEAPASQGLYDPELNADPILDINGVPFVDQSGSPSQSTGQLLLPQILLPGTAGLNIPHLTGLIAEVNALREVVREREIALGGGAAATTAGGGTNSIHPTAKTITTKPPSPKNIERQALLATIEVLSREREEVELERKALGREIAIRKEAIAIAAAGTGGSKADPVGSFEQHETGPNASGTAGVISKTTIDPVLDGVGVERALLDVRGWLDDALNGWKRTGIIPSPASTNPLVINPPLKFARKPISTAKQQQQQPTKLYTAALHRTLVGNSAGPITTAHSSVGSDLNSTPAVGVSGTTSGAAGGGSSQGAAHDPHPDEEMPVDEERDEPDPEDEDETNEDYLPANDGPHAHAHAHPGLDSSMLSGTMLGDGSMGGVSRRDHDGVFDGMEGLDEHEHEDAGEYIALEHGH